LLLFPFRFIYLLCYIIVIRDKLQTKAETFLIRAKQRIDKTAEKCYNEFVPGGVPNKTISLPVEFTLAATG